MDWMMVNRSRLLSHCSSLGWWVGENYHVHEECLESLKAIEEELDSEDPVTHNTRKNLSLSKSIQKDLLPVLIHSQDNDSVFRATVRVLVRLTSPVECLLPVDLALQTNLGKSAVKSLHKLLIDTKRSFLDVRSTEAIIKVLKVKLKRDQDDQRMTENDIEGLSNSLVLLRNLLHIPDKSDASRFGISDEQYVTLHAIQNKLIWNFFVQGLDGVLVLMLNSKYKENWTVVMVQVIALLYKEQDVTVLQHLLTHASSTSESSEDDNESDTSKHSSSRSTSSDSAIKSSPHLSDSGYPQSAVSSSSRCSSPNQIHKQQEEASLEQTDSETLKLAVTSITAETENHPKEGTVEIMFSSSSEEDSQEEQQVTREAHHKVTTKHRTDRAMHVTSNQSGSDSSYDDDQTSRTKQRTLISMPRKCKTATQAKGCKCSPSVCLETAVAVLNSKGWSTIREPVWDRKKTPVLLDDSAHTPSNEDISNVLKNFTVSFLHSGYSSLVTHLMKLYLNKGTCMLDHCHFLWLTSYFMKLATTLELNLNHLKPILSPEVIGFLVFEAAFVCEELELANHNQREMKLLIKRYHLVASAIKELISAVNSYSVKTRGSGETLSDLCVALAKMEDLRHIPLLLIRHSTPSSDNFDFLVDVITTNHLLLLLLERAMKEEGDKLKIDIFAHLSQYATAEVMEKYGLVLKEFKNNSQFVNDCVFTMMHHVAGDLGNPETLFNPHVLSCFAGILQEGTEIPEHWEDLIGYVMNRFIRTNQKSPDISSQEGASNFECSASSTQPFVHPINDESSDSETGSDVGDDNTLYWCYLQFEHELDPVGQIVEHLKRNSVTSTRAEVLTQLHSRNIVTLTQYEELKTKEKKFLEEPGKTEAAESISVVNSEIHDLVIKLKEQGFESHLKWLQRVLLEVCYIKLALHKTPQDPIEEPVPLYFTLLGQSVPLIAFNEGKEEALKNQNFVQLLHKLGFHLATDVGRRYPRVPSFWCVEFLYSTARFLGPLPTDSMKFTFEDVQKATSSDVHATTGPPLPSGSYPPSVLKNSSSPFHWCTEAHQLDSTDTDVGPGLVPGWRLLRKTKMRRHRAQTPRQTPAAKVLKINKTPLIQILPES